MKMQVRSAARHRPGPTPAANHRTPSHHEEPRNEDASVAPAVTPKSNGYQKKGTAHRAEKTMHASPAHHRAEKTMHASPAHHLVPCTGSLRTSAPNRVVRHELKTLTEWLDTN